jgi:DNA modification methylase
VKNFINRILHSDCIDALRSFESETVDLVLTSPPYDNLRDYHGFKFNCAVTAKSLYRVLKPGGVVVWVVGDAVVNGSETGTSFRQALTFQDFGFLLHDTMIYEKSGAHYPASRAGNRYSQTFEYMFIFSKGRPKTANLLCDKPNKWFGTSNWGKKTDRASDGTLKEKNKLQLVKEFSPRNNIWRYVPVFEKNDDQSVVGSEIRRYVVGKQANQSVLMYQHPAIFPEQLAVDHIQTWSKEGDLVLDPMCGSGTTCVAAARLKRNFIGIDVSKDYCQIACDRAGCACVALPVERIAV